MNFIHSTEVNLYLWNGELFRKKGFYRNTIILIAIFPKISESTNTDLFSGKSMCRIW